MMKPNKRVAITGLGPVSAAGIGWNSFSPAILKNFSGISPITVFGTDQYRSHMAAHIPAFDIDEYLESQKAYLDRSSQLALAATALALEDADIDAHDLDLRTTALSLGSAVGSLETMTMFFQGFLEKGPRLVKPFLFQHTYSNTAISLIAIEYGLMCMHLNFASGFVASGHAITEAFDLIRSGRTKVAIAGGFDALSEALFAGLNASEFISPDTETGKEISAPFDEHRNGFILGEGACVLILEEFDHAIARGANIHAELVGCGMASSEDNRESRSSGASAGIFNAMNSAIQAGNTDVNNIDLVMASANGSKIQDFIEANALIRLFGDSSSSISVTSIKPLIGETLGAGSSFQIAASIAAIKAQSVPAIINLRTPEKGLQLGFVTDTPLNKNIRSVLTNSIDPGGSAVSFLVLSSQTTI
ncbi:MAG: hypothetical protein JXN60_07330 [Lentisphaerae bacterium]|nr:hypothetical protein [Lentisphaerota bacterium]